MNERARDLVVLLRGFFGVLPGASSIGLHASERWVLVMIVAASDEAVAALSETLGLTRDIWIGKRSWWHRATSESDGGLFRIVVAGPPHEGGPPRGDAE